MPFSHNALDPVVAAIFRHLCPGTMVDIGPGAGKYGRMMKEAEQEAFFDCRKTAIEINPAYVEQFALESLYDDVWIRDATTLVATCPDLSGDLVVCGDVIEHFPKSRGIDLLEYLLYRFRQVLIVFPIDLPQGTWEGHAAEAHLSLWYPEDFGRYKASLCTSVTSEGYTMCLALMNGVFLSPNERLHIDISGSQVSLRAG